MTTPTLEAERTGQLIAAAERHAEAYDGDDRECIKTDVINAFYAGSEWERRRTATPVAEGVALPPLPDPYIPAFAGEPEMFLAEQVRQAQRDAYELGKRASIDGQLTGAPSPVKQSIDTPEFRRVMQPLLDAFDEYDESKPIPDKARGAWAALIAYIDGRTAGTSQEKKNV